MVEVQTEAVYLLDKDQFACYWSQIESCLDNTDFSHWYTKDWLQEAVREGLVQVWVLSDGIVRLVVFSQMVYYPGGTTFQIFWGYGVELDRFLTERHETMDILAKAMKAERIEIVGRKGWIRKMARYGFEKEAYIISRPVDKKRSH